MLFLQSFSLESILGSNISVKTLTHQYPVLSFLTVWKTAFFTSSQLGGPRQTNVRRGSPLGSGAEKLPSSPQLSSRPGDHGVPCSGGGTSWNHPDLQVTAGKGAALQAQGLWHVPLARNTLLGSEPLRCSISVLLQHSLTFPG